MIRICLQTVFIFTVLFVNVHPLFSVQQDFRYADLTAAFHDRIANQNDSREQRLRFDWMRLKDPATGEIPPGIKIKEQAFTRTLPARGCFQRNDFTKYSGIEQTGEWIRRGPYNFGGRTRALAVDVTNENIIFAGGVSGGLWRSTDGGKSWLKTTNPDYVHNVTCIAQDTRHGKTHIWYYGTGEFMNNTASVFGATYYGNGIFKSTDGGLTWYPLTSTVTDKPEDMNKPFDYIWNIITNSNEMDQDEVFVATAGSIERSTDGGLSWATSLGRYETNSLYTDVAIDKNGVAYAAFGGNGFDDGIYRSYRDTSEVFWSEITPADWPRYRTRIVIGISESNPDIVYFLSFGTYNPYYSLWKYDNSESPGIWEDRSGNIPKGGGLGWHFTSNNGASLVVSVRPDNKNVVFIGGHYLYRSTDGFASHSKISWIGGYRYPDHYAYQHALVFLPSDPTIVLTGSDCGISKTMDIQADAVSWESLNNGYTTTQFYSIALDNSTPNDNVLIGGTSRNGTLWTNSGVPSDPWVNLVSGDGSYCAIAENKSSHYISFAGGTAYRLLLDDEGKFTEWAGITPTDAKDFIYINPFVLDPNNNNVMYMAEGNVVWRNSDLTEIPLNTGALTDVNWATVTNPLASGSVTALAVSKDTANILYYGTSIGMVYRMNYAADASESITWDIWRHKGLPGSSYVNCIAVDPTDWKNAIVVFSNYHIPSLFYTSDGGKTWTDVSGNLEEHPNGSGSGSSTRWAEILPVDSSKIYFVGTSTGLYSTTVLNGAATIWQQEGINTIGNVVVNMIDARESDGLVVAATHGNGVYSAQFTAADRPKLAAIELNQNYPNPFNAETRISFTLPHPGHVELTIYNILGQKIASLLSEYKNAGSHSIVWNGINSNGFSVSSGVFFYKIHIGDFVQIKKMILVK